MPTVDAPRLKEGLPPQGATWDGEGTNFSVFSANATKVEVCLFDSSGKHETDRIELPEYTNQIFHGYLPTVGPGTYATEGLLCAYCIVAAPFGVLVTNFR